MIQYINHTTSTNPILFFDFDERIFLEISGTYYNYSYKIDCYHHFFIPVKFRGNAEEGPKAKPLATLERYSGILRKSVVLYCL